MTKFVGPQIWSCPLRTGTIIPLESLDLQRAASCSHTPWEAILTTDDFTPYKKRLEPYLSDRKILGLKGSAVHTVK